VVDVVDVVDATFACGAGVCDRDDLPNVIIPEVCSGKFRIGIFVCDADVSSLKFYKMKLF
jgi:hypothetical protein